MGHRVGHARGGRGRAAVLDGAVSPTTPQRPTGRMEVGRADQRDRAECPAVRVPGSGVTRARGSVARAREIHRETMTHLIVRGFTPYHVEAPPVRAGLPAARAACLPSRPRRDRQAQAGRNGGHPEGNLRRPRPSGRGTGFTALERSSGPQPPKEAGPPTPSVLRIRKSTGLQGKTPRKIFLTVLLRFSKDFCLPSCSPR